MFNIIQADFSEIRAPKRIILKNISVYKYFNIKTNIFVSKNKLNIVNVAIFCRIDFVLEIYRLFFFKTIEGGSYG